MKKFEKEYQAYLESKSQAADPMERLKEENSHLREGMNRLEHENEFLAQELVASKIHLREEMDRVRRAVDFLNSVVVITNVACIPMIFYSWRRRLTP